MDTLSLAQFVQGFVAELLRLGTSAVRPKSEPDREGFARVVEALNDEITRIRRAPDSESDQEWYRSLVRLRNELQASNSGAFDGFETALRNQQLSFTNSPNPFYEEIAFSVSRPFAQAVLKELPARARHLAGRAAEEFLKGRQELKGTVCRRFARGFSGARNVRGTLDAANKLKRARSRE